MDIYLFTGQLNQLLQTPSRMEPEECLRGVCDLLRIHTGSAVRLVSSDGGSIADLLQQDGEKRSGEHCLAMPVLSGSTSLGTLSLTRDSIPYGETETLAANFGLAVCTILMQYQQRQTSADKKRRLKSVRALINSLSFSELESAIRIVKELGVSEGILVAGHIADSLGFTRSLVTGTLKKLEGASLIETRSLGMKGTYIRIIDPMLSDELKKM